jgi:predicted RecB family nuclease
MGKAFSPADRAILLSVKGVGPTVVQRFEELGIDTLDKLSQQSVDMICNNVAGMLGSTCWKNAPRARQAVADAISAAQAAAPPLPSTSPRRRERSSKPSPTPRQRP